MSFLIDHSHISAATPGAFLESEVGAVRKTRQIAATLGKEAGRAKIVPAGTVWPSNDAQAAGFVYADVDVTSGDMPGSVVLAGRVYEDMLPTAMDEAAKTALAGKGFTFIAARPQAVRPY